ncbi:hypothetical protein F4801DRAFT_574344 [Xylaria longipes]|nr:hypothetical protein F4801DRAFT_574344 [Xylaria longipes]
MCNLLVAPERATTEDGVNEDKRCDGPNAETFSEKCDRLDWDVTDCVEDIEDARDRLLVRRLRSTAIIKHKRVTGNDGNFDGTQDPWELDDTFDGDAFGGGTSRGTASY